MWIEPVYDRTQADVDYAGANPDSPVTLKGARNYTDLSRITGNIHHLRDALISNGYAVGALQSKTVWYLGEIPPRSEINKIMTDIGILRAAIQTFPDTPGTPTLPYTHYRKLNDIERILFDINRLLEQISAEFIFSGEIYSGEDDFI